MTDERRPTIVLAGLAAAYVGPGLPLQPHRKAVITVAVSPGAPFVVEFHNGNGSMTESEPVRFARVNPRQLHRINSDGEMLFLYLDASTQLANIDEAATAAITQSVTLQHAARVAASEIVWSVIAALGLRQRNTLEPWFASLGKAMDIQPERIRSVKQAASLAGLSPSHFQRKMRKSFGVTFRAYRLWKRMGLAVTLINRGSTLTVAALDAGFSSSAHLSATFRQMFGIPLSTLLRLSVEIDARSEGR